MTWLDLTFREWRRRPLRTILTALGVAIAVAGLFSLLSFQRGYRDGVRRELDQLGAHILIVPKGCPYDSASLALHGARWPCYLKAEYLAEVRTTPGVAHAAPALMAAFHEPSGLQAVYVGIDTNMLALRPGWRIVSGVFPRQGRQLLVGSDFARQHHWQVGQEAKLPGLHGESGTVCGLLAPTHGGEDTFVFLPLEQAQALVKRPGELTHILVRLRDPDALDSVVRNLRGCNAGLFMNIVPLAHLFETIQSLLRSTRVLLGAIALVALLAAGAGVSNAVLMSVTERTREIGVLRALGASPGQIFGLFWAQALQVCAVGAFAGIGVAYASSRAVEQWLRSELPFSPSQALIRSDVPLSVLCILCALVLGSVAALLPAWRAAALSPMEAMRFQGGRL